MTTTPTTTSTAATGGAAPGTGRARGLLRRAVSGPAADPRWARPALWALLLTAAALYAWNLSETGYANSYYSAAVKSGTQSWKAFFFGSLDAGSYITVDKPPMALWAMGLTARVLGFGTWSLLLPQVAAGVAAVAVVHATVRRAFGHPAALLAAAVLTLTPITVAINRDNNPDTLLVLFLACAAWACQRAIETGRLRPLLLAALLVGCGFNTKMLQAFLVVPALALAYLVAGRPGALRRVLDLCAAGAVLAASSLWWIALVDLVPAGSRPYIGGSTDGTAWDLVIGYNGLGRVLGQNGGRGGMGGGAGFGGEAGAGRLFNDILGGQISWLLPLSAVALAAGLVLLRRRPRTDPARAALLLWGGWLAVHYAVFSFAQGTFHPYYATAMAPAAAALTGAGAVLLHRAHRRSRAWAWVPPAAVAATGAWAFTLLARTPGWNPWLRWTIAAAAVLATAVLLLGGYTALGRRTRVAATGIVLALVTALAGPASYAVAAASAPVNATNPLAGPATGTGPGGPGGGPGRLPGGGTPPQSMAPPANPGATPGTPPTGTPGTPPTGSAGDAGRGGFGARGGGVTTQMVRYLEENQGGATWLVAVPSAQQASSIILSTGRAVIAMGGFTGSDPAMTVEKLKRYVEDGELRYILIGAQGGIGPGGADTGVTAWVQGNGTLVDPAAYGGTASGTGSGAQLYRLG